MKYRSKPRRRYFPEDRRLAANAFRQPRNPIRRYVVQYEAEVKGQAVSDTIYVLARSEKEALQKAWNTVKSFYPNARDIDVAVKEEHTFSTWKPRGKYGKLIEKANQYWLANRRE